MFAVEVRHHIMIAHSFRGEVFGPAQRTHGATFVVDAAFFAHALDAHGLVVDIGLAGEALRAVLAPLDYRNLDDLPEFAGQNTTTEFLAAHIHGLLRAALREGRFGHGGNTVSGLKVTLRESPNAWAAFEGPVEDAPPLFGDPGA